MLVGYKVVSQLNDSEYGPITYNAYREIRYCLNQITEQDKDKFGPISVFNSLLSAQIFANDMSHLPGLVIFKIKYEQSHEDKLWKKESKITKIKELSTCPPGTQLASVVILESRVD